MTTTRLAIALTVAAASLAACGGASSSPVVAPGPTARGSPAGAATSALVGAAGGAVVSADGRLAVAIPAGALAAEATVTIQPLTNPAPGGRGAAYRVDTGGAALAVAPRLVFASAAGAPLEELSVTRQDAYGWWVRPVGVARDPSAGTLSVATAALGDFTLADGSGDQDQAGTFTVLSTVGVPVTLTAEATLTFLGSDDDTALYVLSGTVAMPASISDAGATCGPAAEERVIPLRTNVLEVPAGRGIAWWGMSGAWTAPCDDGTSRSVDVQFDTFGINHLRCTRTPGAQEAGADRIAGTYTIDCGPEGTLQAVWAFDRVAPPAP